MRSISARLTLAFLLVGLTGALLVAVILRQQTRTAFDRFILDREQQILVHNLVRYYQANGSWRAWATGCIELQDAQAISPGFPCDRAAIGCTSSWSAPTGWWSSARSRTR